MDNGACDGGDVDAAEQEKHTRKPLIKVTKFQPAVEIAFHYLS